MTGEQRADLERLTAFVRETVLPRTCPHTTERRRVLEALGEAGGLCTARTVELSSTRVRQLVGMQGGSAADLCR
ncbi:hypothetical protein JL475_33420 [Streptomyces sp. M2CJ-2]|uniref:hypothetical protein n=1 Tax=Streptomyces sp. M2CJ-2 TaxID=2803948 RepID=UPI0019260F5E|nr:hypothetical protein [Streptomyces sp. M2CJ-2]MBL3670775.1 hypothetical protein [Streptomyces sp. M2CJ-2]